MGEGREEGGEGEGEVVGRRAWRANLSREFLKRRWE